MIDTILLNLIKMLTERKVLNIENESKNYKKLIDQKSDKNIFKIKSDYNSDIYHIMFIYGKLTTIKKIQDIDLFFENSKKDNRIFIGENINQKTYKQFLEYKNTEVFFDYELLINVIDHNLQPKFEVLSSSDIENLHKSYILDNKDIPIMLTTDRIARYYKLKDGDIVRIIRSSITSGYITSYRIVRDGDIKVLFKFT